MNVNVNQRPTDRQGTRPVRQVMLSQREQQVTSGAEDEDSYQRQVSGQISFGRNDVRRDSINKQDSLQKVMMQEGGWPLQTSDFEADKVNYKSSE